ncbi:hypothetical protein K3E25_002095 [Escherichia coli]|nr:MULTISPECIES: hypothetical protein [Enterobacteriaceae]EHO6936921.1 hypothetical protein [Escherichia coli]EHW2851069.1 hypothetical protein [Escherichia coli]EHW3021142.1 hypothetical protein [Escherichia coli]EHW5659595.1 hypothetical protein [Escherichia coli]EHX1065490.1 hypothetical protein [Escherichia coli]
MFSKLAQSSIKTMF